MSHMDTTSMVRREMFDQVVERCNVLRSKVASLHAIIRQYERAAKVATTEIEQLQARVIELEALEKAFKEVRGWTENLNAKDEGR